MEQSSPIANKMFDKRYSMMHIPTKHVQCPWKLLKSVDEEGNISYNLVNLYEKGNEKLLEEQFLEENPSVTREKLDEVNISGSIESEPFYCGGRTDYCTIIVILL